MLLSLLLALIPTTVFADDANVKLVDNTDGQSKSLNDIHDLARATKAPFPSVIVDSLLMQYQKDGSMQTEVVKFDSGNADRHVIGSFNSDFNSDYTLGLFPVATDADTFGNRTVHFPSVSGTSNATAQYAVNFKLDNDNLTGTVANSFSMTFGENGLVTDVKNNLRVSNDVQARKLIVVSGLKRDNGSKLGTFETDDYTKTYATGSLKFFVVSGDKLTPIDCAGIPTFPTTGPMPSFRIAVGDLNHDGSPSEVAVVTGSRDDEYYHLYVYEITASGNAISAKEIFSERTKGRRFKPSGDIGAAFNAKDYGALSDAAALAVADFNGSGKQTLAMAFSDWNGKDARIGVTIYKWGKDSFVSETAEGIGGHGGESGLVTMIKPYEQDMHYMYGTFGLNLSSSRVDDRDVLTIQCYLIDSWQTDLSYVIKGYLTHLIVDCEVETIKPILSNTFREEDSPIIGWDHGPDGPLKLGQIQHKKFTPPRIKTPRLLYTPARCSLAAGSFGGTGYENHYGRAYSYRKKNEGSNSVVVVQMSTKSADTLPKDANDFHEARFNIDAPHVGLLAEDFYGESFKLGEPFHLRVEGRRSYVALLQVPPFHIDFMPATWKGESEPKLNSVTFSPKTEVKYTHSTSSSTEETVDFSQRYSQEIGASLKVSVEASSPNFFGCEASAGASLQTSINNSTSKSESYTNGSQVTTTMTFSSSTNYCDNAVYYGSTMHVWRYPVLKPVHKDFRGQLELYDDPSMYENPTMFLTYTMCDEVAEHSGDPGMYYNATHEEGNLFSYPTSIKGVAGYNEEKNQMTLGKILVKDSSSNLDDSFEISKGFIDEAGILMVGMYINDMDGENGSVWLNYYSKKPDPALVLPTRYTFVMGPLYGTWTVVDNEWPARQLRGLRVKSSKGSIFNDNMLLVPGVEYTITVPIYNASFVPKVGTVRVPVRLSYQNYRKIETRKVIGSADVELTGWMAGSESNKGVAEFHWTVPKDMPQSQYQFCVQLDPENNIDEIHELWNLAHDPCGNNIGFVDFAVWDGAGVLDSSATPRSLMKRGHSTNSNGDVSSGEADGGCPFAITARRPVSASDSSEGVRASEITDGLSYVTITHNDEKPIYNLHCMLAIHNQKEDGTRHFKVIGSWYVPAMFDGDSREFLINYPYDELMAAADEGKLQFVASNPNAKITYVYSREDLGDIAEAVGNRAGNSTGVSGSSGGCDAGLVGAGVLIAVAMFVKRTK